MLSSDEFLSSFNKLEIRLREDGIPLEEIRDLAGCLLGPGITVADYVKALRDLDKVELHGDLLKYREPANR